VIKAVTGAARAATARAHPTTAAVIVPPGSPWIKATALTKRVIHVGKLPQTDLDRSVMTSHTVTQDMGRFFQVRRWLATIAIIITMLIGIPLGVLAAERQDSLINRVIRIPRRVGHSVRTFLLACCARRGWKPGAERIDAALDGSVDPATGGLSVDALIAEIGMYPTARSPI
jgi:ABC-type antimicrobial peptide transport system permease subunit